MALVYMGLAAALGEGEGERSLGLLPAAPGLAQPLGDLHALTGEGEPGRIASWSGLKASRKPSCSSSLRLKDGDAAREEERRWGEADAPRRGGEALLVPGATILRRCFKCLNSIRQGR